MREWWIRAYCDQDKDDAGTSWSVNQVRNAATARERVSCSYGGVSDKVQQRWVTSRLNIDARSCHCTAKQ